MRSRRFIAAAIAALTLVPLSGFAHEDLKDAIEARQGFYQLVGLNTHKLAAMAKGEVDYDAEAAATHARNLRLLSEMHPGALWPEGSDNASMAGLTRAKPEIWSTWPAIQEKVDAWKAAITQLDASAGNGLDSLRGAMGPLGQSCKGCHETYRARDF